MDDTTELGLCLTASLCKMTSAAFIKPCSSIPHQALYNNMRRCYRCTSALIFRSRFYTDQLKWHCPSRTTLSYCAYCTDDGARQGTKLRGRIWKNENSFYCILTWRTVGYRREPYEREVEILTFLAISAAHLGTSCIYVKPGNSNNRLFRSVLQWSFPRTIRHIRNALGCRIASPRGRIPLLGRRKNAVDDGPR